MMDTGFGNADPTGTAALYTPGLMRDDALGDGVLNPSWFSGGGGLTSTMTDYYRFVEMLRGWGRLGDDRPARHAHTGLARRIRLGRRRQHRVLGRPDRGHHDNLHGLLPSSTYPIRSQLRQLVYSALVDQRSTRRGQD
jgi:hypothetical protein